MDSILIMDEKKKTKKLIKLKKQKIKPKKPNKNTPIRKQKKSILFSFGLKNLKPIKLDQTRIVEPKT
jgi:hypothetical protein